MSEKDGGHAFPCEAHDGMTLRDYFAAQVLAGMASRDAYDPGQATPADRAMLAYIDADAMLEARKR